MKKTIRLFTTCLLLASMLLAMLSAFSLSAGAYSDWDGEAILLPEGSGSEEDPFLIASAENLAWISYMTAHYDEANAMLGTQFTSDSVFSGMYFVQTDDIDLGGNLFTPIGTTQSSNDELRNAFGGWYIGDGYTISNAYIDPEEQIEFVDYETLMAEGYHPAGLFGVLADGAVIYGVNACNITLGISSESELYSSDTEFDPSAFVSGVIAGATYGEAIIVYCTTDGDCSAYADYTAGGILGMAHQGAEIGLCINEASVSAADKASGGIVGFGYNTNVAGCLNRGRIYHQTATRWSGAGGIMGMPFDAEDNEYVYIGYCINDEDAYVSATSAQTDQNDKNNRVAVGGIMGNDDVAYNAEITYEHCYNLAYMLFATFVDAGLSNKNTLATFGGISGYTKDTEGGLGARIYDCCYSVDVTASVITYGSLNMYGITYDSQSGYSEYSLYAGITYAGLSELQIQAGVGDPYWSFETCQYGISAEEIKADETYQEILAELGLVAGPWLPYDEETHCRTTPDGDVEYGNHNFDAANVEILTYPTHTGEGLAIAVCTDCGYEEYRPLDPFEDEHVPGGWQYVSATQHAKRCYCGEVVSLENHTWDGGSQIVNPTHTSNGVKVYYCLGCGYSKYAIVPKLTNHTYGDCQPVDGETHERACACGDVKTANHAWDAGEVLTSATHMSDGVKLYTCIDCGATKTEAIAKFAEHIYGDTERHNAKQHKTVCACGDVKYTDHAWNAGEDLISATERSVGIRLYTCNDCGETRLEKLEILPAESGCRASVGVGLGIFMTCCAAALLLKKKKN